MSYMLMKVVENHLRGKKLWFRWNQIEMIKKKWDCEKTVPIFNFQAHCFCSEPANYQTNTKYPSMKKREVSLIQKLELKDKILSVCDQNTKILNYDFQMELT